LSVLPGILTAVPADNDLDWLLTLQRGVLSRSQALACGTTAGQLRHRLRDNGPWQRLLPGVYLTTTGVPTREQRHMAAQLYAGAQSYITGSAALTFYGIKGQQQQQATVDVLIPATHHATSHGFAVMHRTRRMPQQWTQDLALRYALPARAVADAVRGLRQLPTARTVVASAVQRRQCTIRQLGAELHQRHDARDALFRAVLAEVAAGVRSAPESELRDLIIKSGLAVPLFNPRLFWNGHFLASPDAWWPEAGLAVEVDSKEWHLLPEDWERTMARHRRMIAAGLSVIHLSPSQLRSQARKIVADIADALASGRPAAGVTWLPAA